MADVTETRHDALVPTRARARAGVLVLFTEDAAIERPVAHVVEGAARVGRDPGVEVQLPDSQASRAHAEIAPADPGFGVTDLGSRNGTFVAGVRIDAPAALRFGQTLRVGRSLLLALADVEPHRRPLVDALPGMVGGASLRELAADTHAVSVRADAVLIEGETGVGKERVAAALHALSGRTGQLVAVNCAALPKDLVESELFGHARGAFSGSDRARGGLFRSAEGGTLFLDEIAELPLDAQAKLLRALESGEIRGVGEDRSTSLDVRIVAATNAPLQERVANGTFRADLMHRLAAWRLYVPPLRDRREDVPQLAAHFAPSARFSVEAMERLVCAPWPGNVRELRNAVRAAAARAASSAANYLTIEHLALDGVDSVSAGGPAGAATEDAIFRARVDTALRLRQGNVAQVARDLGVGRPWLYQALKRLGIDPAAYRSG